MRLVGVGLALAICGPAMAQDNSGAIDFDALFADNAADVIEIMSPQNGTSRLQLDLPGGVTAWADGMGETWQYSAMDSANAGAGCLWSAYNDLMVLHLSCEGFLTEDGVAQLDAFRGQVGAFVAANTYPPVAPEAFWAYWDGALSADPTLECASLMTPAVGQMVSTLLGAGFAPVLDSILAEPRLPVSTPCF